MTKFTKEQAELHAFITGFLSDPMHDDKSTNSMTTEVFRMALAALTAEPVAWTDADELSDANKGYSGYLFAINGDANKFADPRRQMLLYTAPPAPVVPDGYALVPVEMAPEMMRAVQLNSELGGYAAANLSGAYSLFREFWDVAIAAVPDFREIPDSSTNNCRENAETSTNCPKCGGRGSYHCPQMLGTVECECTLPAAPQQEADNG